MSEEEEEEQPRVMTGEIIQLGLSLVGTTYSGDSCAYLKLDLAEQALDAACEELAEFQHLRYVNLNGNRLSDLGVLARLPHLTTLEAKGNKLLNVQLFAQENCFRHLQFLDLSGNTVSTLSALNLPQLTHLNISNNLIENFEGFIGHPTLRRLELRGNKLNSLRSLNNLPQLEELYSAENNLSAFEGLEGTPSLHTVHLRKNHITALEPNSLPDLPSLCYLNLRENELTDTAGLVALSKYRKLKKLALQECPLSPEPSGDLRKEVLVLLHSIETMNKEDFTSEERAEALAESQERAKQPAEEDS